VCRKVCQAKKELKLIDDVWTSVSRKQIDTIHNCSGGIQILVGCPSEGKLEVGSDVFTKIGYHLP
jgi:hypothetical protein